MLITLLMSGCSTLSTRLNSWIDKPIDSYVSANGAPDNTYTNTDGSTLYTFITKQSVVDDSIRSCKVMLLVRNGVIVSYRYQYC